MTCMEIGHAVLGLVIRRSFADSAVAIGCLNVDVAQRRG